MRRFDFPDETLAAWIGLPDQWLGKHANRRDAALQQCDELDLPETHRKFAVAMALLEDWNIPGLNGNPDNWDFEQLDLRLVTWISKLTLTSYSECFIFPKVLQSPSVAGQTVNPTTTLAAGNSENAM